MFNFLSEKGDEMSMKETLTLERNGEFVIQTHGDNHCGTQKLLPVRYKMVCICKNKLDLRGFLFDQVKVDQFFQKKLTTELSCEKLAVTSLKEVVKEIMKENPGCQILENSLTLSPSPSPFMASITYKSDLKTKKRKTTAKKVTKRTTYGW